VTMLLMELIPPFHTCKPFPLRPTGSSSSKGSFCLFFFKYHIIPQKYYHLDRASISIHLKVRNLGFYGELLRNFTALSDLREQ
jgi:hypothetical protein